MWTKRIGGGVLLAVLLGAADSASAQRTAPVLRIADRLSEAEEAQQRAHLRFAPGVPRQLGRRDLGGGGGPRGDELPAILLTGYWPPSNEGIRRFSTNPLQNPDGWIGGDWQGRGYDVYSFFPEFIPRDCDNCGKGNGDLEVDYQDTSDDFWRIVDEIRPIAVITFSRGFIDMSWELEMNQYNRDSWIGDYVAPFQPTPAPPDPGWPTDEVRNSTLPVQEIVDAVNNEGLGLNAYICWSGDGGGFLSEFVAYHGVWYQGLHQSPTDPDWCIAAGHVHVGGLISWQTSRKAVRVTLRTVIDYLDQEIGNLVCQPDYGYGGPGSATLEVCGDALASGGTADLLLSGVTPFDTSLIVVSTGFNPTPFSGGHLVPLPLQLVLPVPTDDQGRAPLLGIPGGNGPVTVYAQGLYFDASLPYGIGLSNVIGLDFLQ